MCDLMGDIKHKRTIHFLLDSVLMKVELRARMLDAVKSFYFALMIPISVSPKDL
jgi:hypothetical protein